MADHPASPTQPSGRQHLSGDQRAEQVKNNLIAARLLIENPKRWGKGMSEARPGTRCALEAIIEAGGNCGSPEERALTSAIGHPSITAWNDAGKRTHAEVLAAFDKAIASCSPIDHQSAGEASAADSEAGGPKS